MTKTFRLTSFCDMAYMPMPTINLNNWHKHTLEQLQC